MRTILAWAAALALAGCQGAASQPLKPQIQPDRTALQFGTEYGSAVFVGTRPQEALQLKNGGQEDLAVASVSVQGADAALFTATLDRSVARDGERVFVLVTYAPTAPGAHAAQLVIASNAENAPSLAVGLTGAAVAP